MHHRSPPALSAVIAVLAACFVVSSSALAADQYKADPAHSSVTFRSKHMDTSYVFGRFDKFEGSVTYDESDPTKFAVQSTVQVDSIDTGQAKRDAHLKSPDFFSAREFPTITFKSTSAKSAGEGKYEVTGDLTLHGQTKPITVTLEKVGSSTKMGQRVGWISTFTIKRSDYGMSFMLGGDGVGDEIDLTVAFETVKG